MLGICLLLIVQISESNWGKAGLEDVRIFSPHGIVLYRKHQMHFIAEDISVTYILLKLLLSLNREGHCVCFIFSHRE